MLELSFIDDGLKDFIRKENGEVLIIKCDSWEDAEDFIMDGKLKKYGWTNTGTRKYCWNDPDED